MADPTPFDAARYDPTPTPLADEAAEVIVTWLIRGGWVDEIEGGSAAEALRDNLAEGPLADAVAAARAAALCEAATDLRLASATRMDTRGPHDARGAAVWDAAAWLTDRADALVPPTRREGDHR